MMVERKMELEISIHALREEGDRLPVVRRSG